MKPRVELTDSVQDVLIKMSEGNSGALSAMIDILNKHESIDPQAAMGGLGAIMILDTWQIYGPDIYVLWNDKCKRDTRKMLLLMRATQLGEFPESRLRELAADQMRKVNLTEDQWHEIDEKVCNRLDQFQKPANIAA
jgi:hypothetical protein